MHLSLRPATTENPSPTSANMMGRMDWVTKHCENGNFLNPTKFPFLQCSVTQFRNPCHASPLETWETKVFGIGAGLIGSMDLHWLCQPTQPPIQSPTNIIQRVHLDFLSHVAVATQIPTPAF
eukprot:TRINITY_DN67012_c9_g7_i3.p2 TRINITY_DN67012_c9_g7~~TRINITY_DN67012_c9_g7_i3.p2  ORF type:complete len:122 (-),score=3.22 TRINITY_DN67012_c9_g7_i3:935-1300(-)